MCRLQSKDIRNMKKEGNITPPRAHNASKIESKDTEMAARPQNSKVQFFKMINNLKKYSN
jgi:hypothetical protein